MRFQIIMDFQSKLRSGKMDPLSCRLGMFSMHISFVRTRWTMDKRRKRKTSRFSGFLSNFIVFNKKFESSTFYVSTPWDCRSCRGENSHSSLSCFYTWKLHIRFEISVMEHSLNYTVRTFFFWGSNWFFLFQTSWCYSRKDLFFFLINNVTLTLCSLRLRISQYVLTRNEIFRLQLEHLVLKIFFYLFGRSFDLFTDQIWKNKKHPAIHK